jgi:hypothetical protein
MEKTVCIKLKVVVDCDDLDDAVSQIITNLDEGTFRTNAEVLEFSFEDDKECQRELKYRLLGEEEIFELGDEARLINCNHWFFIKESVGSCLHEKPLWQEARRKVVK